MPAPWALAMAVLGMLALGVLIGSVTSHYAHNAGFTTVLLEPTAPPAEEAASPQTTAADPEEGDAGGGEAAAATATPSTIPAEAPLVEEPLPGAPPPEVPLVEEELPTGLPEVKHVFVVDAEGRQLEETFGENRRGELPRQGAAAAGRAADQLLRGDQGRAGEPDRAAERPGADAGNGGQLPELRRRHSRHRIGGRPGRRQRLRLPGGDQNAARPADRSGAEMEGLRAGHRRRRGRRTADHLPPSRRRARRTPTRPRPRPTPT